MTWRHYLRVKTRDAAFLWRMVIGVLAAGVLAGLAVDGAVDAWFVAPDVAAIGAAPQPAPAPPEPWPTSEHDRLEELAEEGQWWSVWKGIPWLIAEGWRQWGLAALAVLTGLSWMAFVMQAIQIRRARDIRLWGPLAGLALGVVSIWLTLFFIFWQEIGWGLFDSEELVAGLRYNILGVGLREELAKFLCFALLLPWLLGMGDELAALLCAAAVGLGFAMEENVGYIARSLGRDTLGRLLMPAPFHMALTGLVGLAAYRACRWPRQWGPNFVSVFGVMVLAHGMYDALISIPELRDLAIGSQIIFIVVMYQFFRELRPLQALRTESISLTANFLLCVSLVAAATFVYLCAAVGWRIAGDVLAYGIAGQAVMVYLFLREMPETMVRV